MSSSAATPSPATSPAPSPSPAPPAAAAAAVPATTTTAQPATAASPTASPAAPVVEPTPTLTAQGEATAKELLKESDDVLYFAIGSMMNPTSLRLREVNPKQSWPGELKEYKTVFVGPAGMASIEYSKESSLHGVLHRLTAKEMEILDKIEASYRRMPVDIYRYDGSIIRGTVYQMDPAKVTITVNNPPSERYIDIITLGCLHYGVKQSFIDWLKAQKFVPRADPKDFKKMPPPADPTKVMSFADVQKCDGCDGRDLCYVLNGKVVKFTGDLSLPAAKQAYAWAKDRFAGKECTFMISRMLYDPKYPLPTSLKDMSEEHKACIEHFWWSNPSGLWTPIAYCNDAT